MRPYLYTGGAYAYRSCLCSPTILGLYVPLTFALIGLFVYFHRVA